MTTPERSVEEIAKWAVTNYKEEKESLVREILPKAKPMSVFSFVLKGEELEQYMRHKGWNECREKMKETIAKKYNIPLPNKDTV